MGHFLEPRDLVTYLLDLNKALKTKEDELKKRSKIDLAKC
jgi:hypothetical protein